MSERPAGAPTGTRPSTSHEGPPRRSIATRARIYLVGGALIALAVAFAIFVGAWSQYTIGQRTLDLTRQVAALAVGQRVRNQVDSVAAATARDRLLKVEAGLIGAALFETDDAGVVQRSTIATPPASVPLNRLTHVDANGTRSGVLLNAAGAQVLTVAAPIDSTRELVAVQSLAEIRRGRLGLVAIAAIALVVAAVVAYVAGGLLAKRLTAPLVRLEGAAEQVAAGAYGTQVAEEGDAETVSLARSFNDMSRRVADTYAAQKAFVGDVSHEIRTPLTSIRGFAEAMLDGTVTDDAQERRALTVIRDEAVRIGELSQTLLSLSELDAGAVEVAREPVDVALLADALRGRFAVGAEGAHVTFEVQLGPTPRPLGDPDRLLQAISGLVTNAIAYTPAGGRVRVRSLATVDRWKVEVDDSGPGIPADKRDAVFDRFARLDASRSTQSGGAGLGLAICARLVELMNGDISASDSDLGGARFTIELPLA